MRRMTNRLCSGSARWIALCALIGAGCGGAADSSDTVRPATADSQGLCPCFAGDGTYCGGDILAYAREHNCPPPDPGSITDTSLLTCTGGKWQFDGSYSSTCDPGSPSPGVGNPAGKCTDAEYNAQNLFLKDAGNTSFWTCQGNSRYMCDSSMNKIVEDCPGGCISEGTGVDDQCNNTDAVYCTDSEFINQDLHTASYWTCQGDSRYVCDSEHHKVTESCSHGCTSAAIGSDDQCNLGPVGVR